MIDSGVKGLLIDKQVYYNNKIKLEKIQTPIPIFNLNGSTNHGGAITNKACLLMRMTNVEEDYHDKQCKLLVTNLGEENIILETDWLHEHNLQINWVKNCLTFASYSSTCFTSRPKIITTMENSPKLDQKGWSII